MAVIITATIVIINTIAIRTIKILMTVMIIIITGTIFNIIIVIMTFIIIMIKILRLIKPDEREAASAT